MASTPNSAPASTLVPGAPASISTATTDYDGSLELDYYGGWSSAIGDTDFGIDVGYIYYDYPGDNGADGDYREFYVSGSWKDIALSVNYSDDYYAGTGNFCYYARDYSLSLMDNLSLGLQWATTTSMKRGFFCIRRGFLHRLVGDAVLFRGRR